MRFLSHLFGLGAALALTSHLPIAHRYQRMRPVTDKNIGRNRLKGGSRFTPHQGKGECARRLRPWARIEARRAGL